MQHKVSHPISCTCNLLTSPCVWMFATKRKYPPPHSNEQKIKPLSYLLLQNLIVAHSNALLITTVDVFVGVAFWSSPVWWWCFLFWHLCLSVAFLQQDVLSAPFPHQTVRRAHGLRSATHSTLFTQPTNALSPQVSVSACMCICIIKEMKTIDCLIDFWATWPQEEIHS